MAESRLNPLVFTSLKDLDIEEFEENVAREMQRQKCIEDRKKVILIIVEGTPEGH